MGEIVEWVDGDQVEGEETSQGGGYLSLPPLLFYKIKLTSRGTEMSGG